ncbi:hypothetical protein V6N12_070503 [Hibiscus sabdariffa]|uniref:RNase H type-1 domain-containing protein n=1 Tax=Hibiscus sabdariffa TaxID=183260 RepID=A0ABR2FH08_9ROSI
MTWAVGVDLLRVHYDNYVGIRTAFDPLAVTSSLSLVRAITLLQNRSWTINFFWVSREQNMVVDGLSKLFLSLYIQSLILDDVMDLISPLLVRDRDGPLY